MQPDLFEIPIPSISLEQALANVIESIALEETALSHILNSQGEILQKTKQDAMSTDELVSVNESVNSIIKNVVKLQMLLQFKLEDTEELLKSIMDFNENSELEE